jgi:hypothetical protein
VPQGKFAVAVVVAVLVFMPLLGEYLSHPRTRPAQPFLSHAVDFDECDTRMCAVDFDGDGRRGEAEVLTINDYHNGRALRVIDGYKELLWMPFNQGAYASPPRLAVRDAGGRTRLLFVYRSSGGLHKEVFAWDGRRMAKTQPTQDDASVFAAMGFGGGETPLHVFGGNEVGFKFSIVKLFFYYMTLCGVAAVCLYRKSVRMSASAALNSSGSNP